MKTKLMLLSILLILISTITAAYNEPVGYELIGSTYHLWNNRDSYYINATSGLQLTNHYEDYWVHNLICIEVFLGKWQRFCGDSANWIWNATTDNVSYVNLTGSLNMPPANIDAKIEYYLELDDTDIRIKPSIKNTVVNNIQARFVWKTKDIQMLMDERNNTVEVNNKTWESWLLNNTLDLSFANLSERVFYINIYPNNHERFGVRFKWDENKMINGTLSSMPYNLSIRSEAGQYNAPINLILSLGQISKGSSVSTSFRWKDAGTCDCPASGNWVIADGSSCSLGSTCNLGTNRLRITSGKLKVYGSCLGQTSCTSYSSQANCNTCSIHGCSWDAANCYGTHNPCSTYTIPGDCGSHGCTWIAGQCTGTPLPCSTHDQANCVPSGCTWDAADCYGTFTKGALKSAACYVQSGQSFYIASDAKAECG